MISSKTFNENIDHFKQKYYEGKTIVVSRFHVQQINFSQNAGYYLTTVKRVDRYAKPGRFHCMNPTDFKHLDK